LYSIIILKYTVQKHKIYFFSLRRCLSLEKKMGILALFPSRLFKWFVLETTPRKHTNHQVLPAASVTDFRRR